MLIQFMSLRGGPALNITMMFFWFFPKIVWTCSHSALIIYIAVKILFQFCAS